MNEIKDILEKASIIGQTTKFKVRHFEFNSDIYTVKLMTYIELGSFLIMSRENIDCIDIRLNK